MIATAVSSVLALTMVAPPFTGPYPTRLIVCIASLTLSLFIGIINLSYPDLRVQAIGIVCVALRCFAILVIIEVMFRSGLNRVSNRSCCQSLI
jgi:hypothetical protein